LQSNLEGIGQFSYSTKEQRTIIQPVPLSDQFALPAQPTRYSNVAPATTFGGRYVPLQGPGRPNASPYYRPRSSSADGRQHAGPADPLPVRDQPANRDISDISDRRASFWAKSVIFGWDSDACS